MPGHVHYSHRQFARAFMAMMLAALLAIAAIFALAGAGLLIAIPAVVIAIVAGLFYSLQVEIDEELLHLRFGFGLIHKRWPLQDIRAVREVRNKWWYGLGIRLTPHGWLYAASGLDAVELELRSGKTPRIGTDEPAALRAALERALQRAATLRSPIDIRD